MTNSNERHGMASGSAPVEEKPRADHPPLVRARSLDQMAVEGGLLSLEQAAEAREAAQRESLPLERVLVRDGLVLSKDIGTLLALHLGIPMVDLGNQTIDPGALSLLP